MSGVDADKVYFINANHGAKPWVLQDGGAPEEISYDKTSDFYKDSGRLGKKFVLLMDLIACLPHAITRVDLSP